MNKKIFGGIATLAIAAAVALNVTLSNQKQDAASMLALANVEALAQSENIIGGCYWVIEFTSISSWRCYNYGYGVNCCLF